MSELAELAQQVAELKGRVDTLIATKAAPPKKGLVEIIAALSPFLSGVLIASAGIIATFAYNRGQLQLAQLNALDKYRSYLSSDDPQERAFGYEAYVALGQETFVAKLIGIKRDAAGADVLVRIAEKTTDDAAKQAAQKSLLDLPQERRVRAMLNIFETGDPTTNYGRVQMYGNHLTYGSTGLPLDSEAFTSLLRDYVGRSDARYANQLSGYMERVDKRDATLAQDDTFKALLRSAGDDPLMRGMQERHIQPFFDRAYAEAARLGIRTPLGIAVVFDSSVHGGWKRISKKTEEQLQGTPLSGIKEELWIKTYLHLRRDWLGTLPAVAGSAFRVEALLDLAERGNWELLPPIQIRGKQITD